MLFKSLTVTAFALFLFLIINMGFETRSGQFLSDTVGHIPFGDKTIHFLLMALFSFLVNGSLNTRKVNIAGRQWLIGSLAVAGFITLEECSQAFIPARNFEIMDMVCNYAGIYAGGLLLLTLLPGHGHKTTGTVNERITTFSFQTIFNRTR